MWYGQVIDGKEFFWKNMKPFNWMRPDAGVFFKAKTKKELFKQMDTYLKIQEKSVEK